MDVLNNPVTLAVLALLALPGVTSGLTALLRRIGASGVDPRVVVYVASLVLTGVVLLTAGSGLPMASGEPSAVVAAWLTWLTVNAELARRLYEALLVKVWPAPSA